VCGNVDAGKSTLLGVLTSGILDNGRGLARSTMFRHKHEKETGRTSSVSHNILGFDGLGKVVEARDHSGRVDWPKVCERASKVITFIDLAGHAAYLKTTMGGLMGSAPHFLVMVVAANAGILGTFKEHLGLALALRLPIVVVVTKIDMTPDNIREDTINLLTRILKSPGCRKIPVHLKSTDDVVVCARNFMSERVRKR
jgi:GTPase